MLFLKYHQNLECKTESVQPCNATNIVFKTTLFLEEYEPSWGITSRRRHAGDCFY